MVKKVVLPIDVEEVIQDKRNVKVLMFDDIDVVKGRRNGVSDPPY